MVTHGVIRFVKRSFIGMGLYMKSETGAFLWRSRAVFTLSTIHFVFLVSIAILLRYAAFPTSLLDSGSIGGGVMIVVSVLYTWYVWTRFQIDNDTIRPILGRKRLMRRYRCYLLIYVWGMIAFSLSLLFATSVLRQK